MLSKKRWKTLEISHPNLIMWGASDQCRVNFHILRSLGANILALIDDTPEKSSPFKGIPIYMGETGLDAYLRVSPFDSVGFVLAIGNPYGARRVELHNRLKERGLNSVSFIDPTSLVCDSVHFGDGLQVMPGVIVNNDVRVGNQCIINTRALVEHDCVLSDGVEIGPGAVLCGRVEVGRNSWIGANSTIRPRVKIGHDTIIGAGSVVVTDIPSNVVAYGVPARVVRENRSFNE